MKTILSTFCQLIELGLFLLMSNVYFCYGESQDFDYMAFPHSMTSRPKTSALTPKILILKTGRFWGGVSENTFALYLKLLETDKETLISEIEKIDL